ncbi:MAG: cation:proton antiporter [bacterium]
MIFIYFIASVLAVSCFMCLYRIGHGPTAPDRTVAVDILGTVVVGFVCLSALVLRKDYYMNLAIAWALVSFIGTVALAKHLEGRRFDE